MRLSVWCFILMFAPRLSLEAQRETRSAASAFTIEALGGAAGSALGVGAGLLVSRATNECSSEEDLECQLRQAATTGLVSVVGATAGTYLAGRAANAEPSFAGSLIGAVAGAAAGVGVIHLLTEEANVSTNNTTLLVAYSLTQGVVAALGSRIVAALRE